MLWNLCRISMDLTRSLCRIEGCTVHCTISKHKLNDYKTHSNFLETSRAICTTACAFILISREIIIILVPVIKAMF
jgi:hypothetical protein